MWTRLEQDLTPFPNSHDLVTRLGARPLIRGRLPVPLQLKVAMSEHTEGFFAIADGPQRIFGHIDMINRYTVGLFRILIFISFHSGLEACPYRFSVQI